MKNLFAILLLASLSATGYFYYKTDEYRGLYLEQANQVVDKSDNRLENACVKQLKGHIAAREIHHTSAMKTMFYNYENNIMTTPFVEMCKAVDQYGSVVDGKPKHQATLFRCSTHMHSYAGRPQSYVGCFADDGEVKAVKVYFDPGWQVATIKPSWKMGSGSKMVGLEFLPRNSTFGKNDGPSIQGADSSVPSKVFRRDAKRGYGSSKQYEKLQMEIRNKAAGLGRKYRSYEEDLNKCYIGSGVLFVLFLIAAIRSRNEENYSALEY